ncbi:MAG: hypothetical protein HYY40_14550 [Bacteroidetes bacterium]|nr:hypothetical protein [Bacteroidota bacterium]
MSFLIFTQLSLAQTGNDGDSAVDPSNKNLKRLYKWQDFYINQSKKSYIPEKYSVKYSSCLGEVEQNIRAVRSKRLELAQNNTAQAEKEKFSFQFRDMDVDVSRLESPVYYAYEFSSWVFNLGISLLDLKKYSTPVVFTAEKIFTERLSGGLFLGYFNEKFRQYTNYPVDNNYFTSNKWNYKYNDGFIGARGSFHLLNPVSKLSFRKFDIYVTGLAGFNIVSNTIPFFDNEKYLDFGKYDEARKKGIVYGGFGGIRYMYDDMLGFYFEGGYANTAFASAGLTLRLLNKQDAASRMDAIVFKVKLLSSSRPLALTDPKLKGLTGVELYPDKNGFIYTTGNEPTLNGAEAVKESMIKFGFKKAEIVAFKNDEMISVKKAAKIQKKIEKETLKEELPGTK